MKFVLEQNRAYYYTDPAAWMLRATSAERKTAYDSAVRETRNTQITESDIEKLKASSPLNPSTPAKTGVSELSTKLHEMQLKAELWNLSGLVFLDGTFDVHQSDQGA
jgi:hypothetical protein